MYDDRDEEALEDGEVRDGPVVVTARVTPAVNQNPSIHVSALTLAVGPPVQKTISDVAIALREPSTFEHGGMLPDAKLPKTPATPPAVTPAGVGPPFQPIFSGELIATSKTSGISTSLPQLALAVPRVLPAYPHLQPRPPSFAHSSAVSSSDAPLPGRVSTAAPTQSHLLLPQLDASTAST